jgi:hypothetical protein
MFLSMPPKNSRATPTAELSSSTAPRASKTASLFGRRSPVYMLEVPLSPVFVYILNLSASGAARRVADARQIDHGHPKIQRVPMMHQFHLVRGSSYLLI